MESKLQELSNELVGFNAKDFVQMYMDLSSYIKKDVNYNNLNKRLLNAITIDSKICGQPVGTILGFNIKWSNALMLTKQENEKGGVHLFKGSVKNILNTMLIANMPDLIDIPNKTYDLKQGWFLDLCRDFKEAATYKYFNTDVDDYRLNQNYIFMEDVMRGFGIDEYFNYLQPKTEYLPPLAGEKSRNRVAASAVMYSISNKSRNKGAAWNFLSYLLDESTETLDSLMGAPLNLKADEKKLNTYTKTPGFKEMYEEIRDVDYMYSMTDFREDMLTPLMEYMNDKITLDEAMEKAEYNVWLRLNE